MHENTEWYKAEFIKRFGAVTRARGCYLYTQKGVRVTDLYRENAHALLGWGSEGGKAFRVLKNTIDRGQTGSFPTVYEKAFEKAALSLVSGYTHARWFFSKQTLLNALLPYAKNCKRWNPWAVGSAAGDTNARTTTDGAHAVFFPAPLPFAQAGYIALFSDVLSGAHTQANVPSIPASEACSAAFFNALSRALYDLKRFCSEYTEKDFSAFDDVLLLYFKRCGPYLTPVTDKKNYRSFVLHCLDCALLVSPLYEENSIIPFGANPGDFIKLKRNPFV